MHNLRRVTLWLLLALSTGCATRGKQSKAFLASLPDIPPQQQIAGVPFIAQKEFHCGPASVAMLMNWGGHPVSANEIARLMLTPKKKGSFQEDLIGASRRLGFLAIPIYGIPNLMAELAAGNPVVVLQNLLASWYPKWHYTVAVGYDLPQKSIIQHDANGRAFERVNLNDFEVGWSLADYWGLVILPPTKLSATADDLKHAESAAVFERLGKISEAETVYKNILERWPQSLAAYVGLGNTRYTAKDYKMSVHYLREASRKFPDNPIVWHNLATAQGEARQTKAARASARRAMSLAPALEATRYRESLQKFL